MRGAHTVFLLALSHAVFAENHYRRSYRDANTGIDALNITESVTVSAKSFYSECGSVFSKEKFVIESPKYPASYPHNLDCSYLLEGPTCARHFSFEFLDFSLENSPGCVKDRLEIQDKDALCGIKSGTKKYFTELGALEVRFVTDNETSSRGYRILVTRLPCISDRNGEEDNTYSSTDETTIFRKWYTTNKDSEWTTSTIIPDTKDITIPLRPGRPAGIPINPPEGTGNNYAQCCQNAYRAKRFILTSPGFPETSSRSYDCQYKIYRAHPNICRLRLHILFFWLSPSSDNQCAEGFLQVDNKLLCGCKSELKLITTFDYLAPNAPKILRFKTPGKIRDAYTGFAIDVIQDECPTKYVPSDLAKLTIKTEGFNFQAPQFYDYPLPNYTHEAIVEKLDLVGEGVDVLPLSKDYSRRVVRYFYYFVPPRPEFELPPVESREFTTYFDISTMNTVVPDLQDYGYCLDWNKRQLNMIYFNNRQNLPVCRASESGNFNKPPNRPNRPDTNKPSLNEKCYELNYVNGYFHSPGYPNPYPNNVNLCYRFRRQRGYCSVRMVMQDFEIEDSPGCQKDYVLLGNKYRYCGTALHKTTSNFDLRNREYEDMFFVTDGYSNARGFSGVYEQIKCTDNFPVDPVPPLGPPSGPIVPTTPPPPSAVPCDGVIRDRVFSINIFDHNAPRCRFIIKRYHPDVCQIKLYFAHFDLICTTESLIIGDRKLCGRLTGQTATVELGYGDTEIIYQKTPHTGIRGARLRIRGMQIIDDCGVPEVPPQLKEKSDIVAQLDPRFGAVSSNISYKAGSNLDNEYLVEIREHAKIICGIVSNTTDRELPMTFCAMLLTNNDVVKCTTLDETLIVPDLTFETKTLEVTIEGVAAKEEVKFKEIDCDRVKEET